MGLRRPPDDPSLRTMRDRLAPGDPRQVLEEPSLGTMVLGFEEDSTHLLAAGVAEAPFFRYGPLDILTIAPNVDRVVLERLTVMGSPPGFFVNRCWWTLQLDRGGVQEFIGKSRITAPVALVDPATAAGVRHTDYGSYTLPQPVDIQLAQSGTLQLVVLSRDDRSLTVWTRTTGKQYNRVR